MARPDRTWLVIEPTFSGHHFSYLLEICRGATARGIHVVVGVGDDAQGDRIYTRLLAELPPERLSVASAPTPPERDASFSGLLLSAVEWRRFFGEIYRKAAATASIDHVFVPYLDRALYAISAMGSPFGASSFGGITLRQRFHLSEMGVTVGSHARSGWRRWLFVRMLRSARLRSVHVIDDTLQEYIARKHPELAGKVQFIPDPSDPVPALSRFSAREALGLPQDAVVVLVYGHIDARKGVDRLLRWLTNTESSAHIHALLVGTLSKDIVAQLETEQGAKLRSERRLWLINEYVDQAQELRVFSAADYVWLAYENVELMSGVLVKAAQFGKGVLFYDYGLIGRYAKRFGSQRPLDAASGVPFEPPNGLAVRYFDADSTDTSTRNRLPDHSWRNAAVAIFG